MSISEPCFVVTSAAYTGLAQYLGDHENADKLNPIHFGGAQDVRIHTYGFDPASAWYRCIVESQSHIDDAIAKADVLDVAARCIEGRPDIRAFLLECTNLSPWKKLLKEKYRRSVFDLIDSLEWVAKGY